MNTLEMSSSFLLPYNVQFPQILIITGESLILLWVFWKPYTYYKSSLKWETQMLKQKVKHFRDMSVTISHYVSS